VSWAKRGKWRAVIRQDGKNFYLGCFTDEQDAAEAFDAKARELRGEQRAHGGRSGPNWWRLNFPTAQEEAYAAEQGMPTNRPTDEENAEREKKAAEQHYKSSFVGVCWSTSRKWQAVIHDNGKNFYLGHFHDELAAAKAFDAKARGSCEEGSGHTVGAQARTGGV
jgi:hypothetical protein